MSDTNECDDDVKCGVCFIGEWADGNPIVICESCGVAVSFSDFFFFFIKIFKKTQDKRIMCVSLLLLLFVSL